MIYTPPFYLTGEAGKSLGAEGVLFSQLGVKSAVLTLRSLDVDVLQFSIRAASGRIVPDDGQWLTLTDDANQVIFTGLARRSFSYAARLYDFTVSNVYKGLLETPLLNSDRAFVLYGEQDLGTMVLNILGRGITAGLPMRLPKTMPALYLVPKMAFRAQAVGTAAEDALKWAPDAATRMDYSTTPPTLRFFTRTAAEALVVDLESDGHKATDIKLTPVPEARALAVSFAYARRDGDAGVIYLVQTAGDDAAEATRRLSLYLSGEERADALVSEALLTAQAAVAKVNEVIIAGAISVDAVAAAAQIPLTWAGLKPLDSNLQAAETAQPGFSMYASVGYSITLYTGSSWSGSPPSVYTTTMPTTAVALRTSGGALATGWYPIQAGSFTTEQLATAGANKETRYITGSMLAMRQILESNAGMASIESAGAISHTGWIDGYGGDAAGSDADWRKYVKYGVNIAVDAIDMSPSAVAAAVTAAASGSAGSAFPARADFVEAPPDLAQNYFNRQDWLPFKGTMEFAPSVPTVPLPGDFVSVLGDDVPVDWHEMKVPVAETSIDLQTMVASVTIGPSPRMNFSSLVDRLRIPAEDNYQPG